jgi:class 3 adenylate cyclase
VAGTLGLGLGAAGPLLREPHKLATAHAEITVLFADVVGFTPMCRELAPEVVMAFLNDLFSRLDELTTIYGVYKVETIGGERAGEEAACMLRHAAPRRGPHAVHALSTCTHCAPSKAVVLTKSSCCSSI